MEQTGKSRWKNLPVRRRMGAPVIPPSAGMTFFSVEWTWRDRWPLTVNASLCCLPYISRSNCCDTVATAAESSSGRSWEVNMSENVRLYVRTEGGRNPSIITWSVFFLSRCSPPNDSLCSQALKAFGQWTKITFQMFNPRGKEQSCFLMITVLCFVLQ